MPKLKSILSRVILGQSRQKEDGLDYLCAGFERYMIESHSLLHPIRDDDDDDDDGTSISSFSTTATADNLPGTGRTVDKYFFQPIGRRIERLATRFTIASPHHDPDRIAQYMETDDTILFDDDRNSISSFSTTATADNLSGTGRTVDTYLFQPIGRRIERLAMRFTIASLHPARIAQYMEMDYTGYRFSGLSDCCRLNDAIADLCRERRNGSTVVAGMKGLVKQTQSTSINRSALALAALIRVSLTVKRQEVYVNVSRIEPIFQLETLAKSLAFSHPERKWFLFLVKLARETLIAVREPSRQRAFDPVLGKEATQLCPSPETALTLRQRLIRVLRVYRYYGHDSLEDTIGEACAICAKAVSTYVDQYAQGDVDMHIMETVYFTVIFLLRSIHELANYAKITAIKQIYTVLRTLASWIDAIVLRCLNASDVYQRYDANKLMARVLFISLVKVDGDTTCVLLPQSSLIVNSSIPIFCYSMDTLPRRYRDAAEFANGSLIAQGLTDTSVHRTRRLLRSFSELEREVFGGSLETFTSISHAKIDADPYWDNIEDFGNGWWEHWVESLERARRVQVPENLVTEEFRRARRIGLGRNVTDDEDNWGYYQVFCDSRHKWGQYLRSNMDWDWDLGTSMNNLFTVEERIPDGLLVSDDISAEFQLCH